MLEPTSEPIPRMTDRLQSPLAQGVLTGAMTLIPARNYPRWIRRSLVWGPLVLAPLGAAYLGANPQLLKSFTTQQSAEQSEDAIPESTVSGVSPEVLAPTQRCVGATKALLPGVALGGLVSGMMVAGFWSDEQLERGLRRLRVPYPRLIMGGIAGVITWRTAQTTP